VPASSANLGPGLDCLGLALALYHDLTVVEEPGTGLAVEVAGRGARQLPADSRNAVYQAMAQVLAGAGCRPGRLHLRCASSIPLAAGLGSSAAAYVAGAAAGMVLCGRDPDPRELVERGTRAEGHPDNVVPCVCGGFTVAAAAAGGVDFIRLEVPAELRAVVAVPGFRLPTRIAREALPAAVPLAAAAFNVGRASMLVAAVTAGAWDLLRAAMQDALHQPYRSALVPGLEQVCTAAVDAGALGAALSGAGPAIVALARAGAGGEPQLNAIGAAMVAAWRALRIESEYHVLGIDRQGLRVAQR